VAHAALLAGNAGAYHDRWHWPVTSPSGLASWVSDVQRYMIANPALVGWPSEWTHGHGEQYFFNGDEYHFKPTASEQNRLNGLRPFNNAAVLARARAQARAAVAHGVQNLQATLTMQNNFGATTVGISQGAD
jgi:hypothetical protein